MNAAFTLVNEPISTPSGKTIATARAKPSMTRQNEIAEVARQRPVEPERAGTSCTTSTGLGRMVGEMIRLSASCAAR